MIATPLLAMFMDVQSAVLITLFPTIAVNLLSIYRGGGWGDSIGRFWPLALFAFIGSVAGTNLLVISDPEPFRLALAGIIILYLNLHRLTKIKMNWIEDHIYLSMLLFGLIAGVFAGSVNVMVPILMIFTLELGLAMTVMIQTFNMCFLSGKVAQVGVFYGAGMIDMELLRATIIGLVLAVLALRIGMSLRDRINSELYQKTLRKMLLLMAAILIGQFFLS
jgi:uncharacterized membrane protein YfcA